MSLRFWRCRWLGWLYVWLEWPLKTRHVVIHICSCAAFMLAYLLLRAAVALWQPRFGGPAVVNFFDVFEPLLVKTLPHSLLVYWAIVSVQHVAAFQERARERERRAAELEQRLIAAAPGRPSRCS